MEVDFNSSQSLILALQEIEVANRLDLLSQLTEMRLEAEQESFNVLKFGLKSKYAFYRTLKEPHNASGVNLIAYSAGKSITTSFIAINPYPHHIVASVRLMKRNHPPQISTRQYQTRGIILSLVNFAQSSGATSSKFQNDSVCLGEVIPARCDFCQ